MQMMNVINELLTQERKTLFINCNMIGIKVQYGNNNVSGKCV